MMKERILVVDDDENIKNIFDYNLSHSFDIKFLYSAEDIFKVASEFNPLLILLDINLPKENGFHVCSELQKNPATQHIPVFFISSRADLSDRISGLNLGAEDYIVKPFEPLELEAKINAKIQRYKMLEKRYTLLKFKNINIDTSAQKVFIQNPDGSTRDLNLSPVEIKFLVYLIKNQNKLLSRDDIMKHVWGDSVTVTNRSVDVYASYLRRKVPDLKSSIRSVYGNGYCLSPSP